MSDLKKLLLSTLEERQKHITGIKPPDPAKKVSYDKLVQSFSAMRGAPLFFPYIGSGLGKGPFVELMDGSVKYDFISGIGVHFFGHSHREIVAACIESALSNTIMQGPLQQNIDSFDLTKLLVEASGIDCCFLSTSGAMANENGLKIAFQKKFPASRVLAFERTFSGRTLVLSSITDKSIYRKGLPKTLDVDYVPFYDYMDPEGSLERAEKALKSHIKRYPKNHAAMIFELVQGEGGFYPGTELFFKSLMEILKQEGILVFVDEIQTFGRLSKLFAFQHFNLDQFVDIVTIGKLTQSCATLFRKEIAPERGLISQTFSSSTASIKASEWIIEELLRGGYYGPDGKMAKFQKHFHERLRTMKHVSGPFGLGGMVAFTPYDGTFDKTVDFVKRLFDAGVLSFYCGENPTRVRFLIPAGAITIEDIDAVLKIVEKTLDEDYASL